MDWFYNKKISIYEYTKKIDENGIVRSGVYELALLDIPCDVQPYSAEKLKRDYGYDLEVSKRVFCDIYPEILESSVVLYRNQTYKIQKIIEWDDFYELMLIEKDYKIQGINL